MDDIIKNTGKPLQIGQNKTFRTISSHVNMIRKEIFIAYIIFSVLSIILLSVYTKGDLHLILNQYNSSFFDWFFKYTTHLGDGVMFGVLVVIFFFINKRMSLVFGIGGVLTLLVTHFFKKVIFRGIPRPAEYLGIENLHIIDGIKMAFWNSFPSGHTMTAFAIFAILCIYFRKCISQYLWMSLAIIAGISRVYLSQHFWADIFVGSVLGIIIAFVSMSLFFPERKKIH
ncbi:acidPPc domain-containing protein [Tenacibaculum sp. 190524A05c]|uniref:phosphatase PAP2 family protein n=1 Tax=Tenacibaculum platacis TaxID=3137852 RepID=UPI0031FA7571